LSDFLQKIMPNVVDLQENLIKAIGDTLIMVGIAGSISIIFGLLFGIILVVTAPKHIFENKIVYSILGKIINVFRSIPFVILLALLLPITKLIVGTSIGIKGAVVPMIIGIIPFIARLIEQALSQIDNGVIEAAKSMGVSRISIVWRVMIKEGMPGIVRALVISGISLIGLSAMAGTVGGGGLGDFAIRYGYARFMTDITIVTVLILLIMVSVVQGLGNFIIKKIVH